jgi:hypothetical protein
MDELGRPERADELEAEESDRSMWSFQVVRIVSLQQVRGGEDVERKERCPRSSGSSLSSWELWVFDGTRESAITVTHRLGRWLIHARRVSGGQCLPRLELPHSNR